MITPPFFTAMMMQHNSGQHTVVTYNTNTTKNNGKSWLRSNAIAPGGIGHHAGITETTIKQLKGRRAWMLMRTQERNPNRKWHTNMPGNIFLFMTFFISSCVLFSCKTSEKTSFTGKAVVLRLDPSENNPRNSEGSFITLKDGRILFVYTHFTGGGGDHASAFLAGRYSSDGGKTWTDEDEVILTNEGGMNIMSVSLLRLQNGDIALFYIRKNSLSDARARMRISKDEAKTWSESITCITDRTGYFVLNNDRVIQLENERLLMPVSLHKTPETEWSNTGRIWNYYSDDNGKTWSPSEEASNPDSVMLQEPGVVALKDGRIMMFMRNDSGVQYLSYSEDKGETWSPAEPSNIKSPVSPASIRRIPSTGDLLMAWNNNGGENEAIAGKRTPFNVAISKDEGKTWEHIKTVEDDPNGWYCYTAIEFVEDHVLLGHCAGNRLENNGLAVTHITRLDLDWIHKREN